jgi:hypothetical protein
LQDGKLLGLEEVLRDRLILPIKLEPVAREVREAAVLIDGSVTVNRHRLLFKV